MRRQSQTVRLFLLGKGEGKRPAPVVVRAGDGKTVAISWDFICHEEHGLLHLSPLPLSRLFCNQLCIVTVHHISHWKPTNNLDRNSLERILTCHRRGGGAMGA